MVGKLEQICIITAFLSVFMGILTATAQVNRALLVAIDSYPANSGWEKIHSTNDLKIIHPMLVTQGYSPKHIKQLINEEATKKVITQSLDSLIQQSNPGDYIYIHFSGHGQLMVDDNGDETDGLDESFIPYDAQRRYKVGVYEGQNHLRDDELGEFVESFRKKIGKKGKLTVVIDACHSGTGTRKENEYKRGTTYIFAPPNKEVYKITDKISDKPHLTGKTLAPFIIISACLPEEINYEYYHKPSGLYYGALSFAICQVMNKSSQKISTANFMEQLKTEVARLFQGKKRKQTPYIETNDEKQIFAIGIQ